MAAAATAALSKEEQELYEAMKKDEPPPAPKEEAKAAAEVPAKQDEPKKAEEAKKAEEHKKADGVVPKAALDEARIENKDLRKQLKEMQSLVAEGDKKLKSFMEGVQKRLEGERAPAHKYEEDAAGHLKHETETLKAENAALRKAVEEVNRRFAKQEEGAEAGNMLNRHAVLVQSREQAFAKANPDYWKAAEYVAQAWRDEFIEAGYPEEEISQRVFHKSIAITQQAVAKEKDPAETIYKMAKRLGFQAPKAEDQPKQKEEAKKPDAESKLETIAKGLDAAKSAGGASGPDDITIASLAQMSDEELDKIVRDDGWWAKNVKRSPLH